ncbi:MAG: PEGA domain-containing protein [Polyangiaceae bacterium]
MRRSTVKSSAFAIALGAGLLLSPPAFAQNVEQAKELFQAGAQYYANGQYAAAIQAFEAANKIVPKPAIEFSIAQAHRRQYFVDKNPEHLSAAIRLYQDYIAKGGARTADAAQALEELQTIANRMSAEERAQAARAPTKEPPRLMVMSQTPGAQVTLDSKLTKPIPFGPDVTAGKHHVHVFAPGYFDYDQDVDAFDNTVTPVNADLKEKTAHLTLDAPANATVSIDGRFAGTTPLPAAIQLPAGHHLLVITKNGHKAFVQEIDLKRDERKTLSVKIGASGQRIVADSLLISAVGAAIVGGVFTGVALVEQGKASDLNDRRGQSVFTEQDAADYDFYKSARNRWGTVAGVAYGVSAASLLTGIVFYVFDQPTVNLPPERFEESPSPSQKNQRPTIEPLEMGMAPLAGPNVAGAMLFGRF